MIEIEVQNETHQTQERIRFAAVPRIGEGVRLREPDGCWASYDVLDLWYQKAEYGDVWVPYLHICMTPSDKAAMAPPPLQAKFGDQEVRAIHGLIKRTGQPAADEPRPRARAAIPAHEQPQPVAPPQPPQQRAARQCLIVDDSRVIRKVSRRIVEGLGYTVTEAENGEEALARCRAAMPDLVITDWNMPVMEGIEFVATLRQIPADRQPKVVFCTTNGGVKDIHKGIEAGADEYIIKPFDEGALLTKLQAIGAA